jgi:hypothetical protein
MHTTSPPQIKMKCFKTNKKKLRNSTFHQKLKDQEDVLNPPPAQVRFLTACCDSLFMRAHTNSYTWRYTACSLGLSATSQQYFSLRTNQPPATSQQYSSLRTNQHQPSAASQPNKLIASCKSGMVQLVSVVETLSHCYVASLLTWAGLRELYRSELFS